MTEGTKSSEGEEEPFRSDDNTRKVGFEDSQDERTIVFDDGFKVIEVDRPKDGTNRVEIKGKSYRIKVCVTKSPKKKLTPKKKKLKLVAPPRIAKSHKRMYEREDKYVNDELGSTYQMPLKMKNFQNMKSLGRNS